MVLVVLASAAPKRMRDEAAAADDKDGFEHAVRIQGIRTASAPLPPLSPSPVPSPVAPPRPPPVMSSSPPPPGSAVIPWVRPEYQDLDMVRQEIVTRPLIYAISLLASFGLALLALTVLSWQCWPTPRRSPPR